MCVYMYMDTVCICTHVYMYMYVYTHVHVYVYVLVTVLYAWNYHTIANQLAITQYKMKSKKKIVLNIYAKINN